MALLLFMVGAALLIQGIWQGEGEVYLFLVFPVFVSRGPLSLLGSLLILASLILGFLSTGGILSSRALRMLRSDAPMGSGSGGRTEGTEKKVGGVLLLGPIPIVLGSNERITRWMLVAGVIITIVLLLLFLTSVRG